MVNSSIVIGGLGVIGKATRELFGIEHYIDHKGQTMAYPETGGIKYVFICLPTPANDDGYNVEPIYGVIKEMEKYAHKGRIYILRSTVIPGTTESLMHRLKIKNIVHNPEFLTMSTITEDMHHPDLVVAGSIKKELAEEVLDLYRNHIPHEDVEYVNVLPGESEAIKEFINLLYASKVIVANQYRDSIAYMGIDYDKVKYVVYRRKWIGANHLDVWHQGKRGAGGMCLKKDLEAYTSHFKQPLFQELVRLNNLYLEMKQ